MKIAFFGLTKNEEDEFRGAFPGSEEMFFEEKLNIDTVEKAVEAEIACVFVGSAVSREVMDKMPNLKYIATRSTGYDHIDLEYARSKGIQVSNVPGYGSHTVAEFAFGLILNLSRKIIPANTYIRESSDFNYFLTMEGFDLAGKVLGVIGTGKIGKNVIKMAKAFNMEVVAYDLYPDAAFAKENDFEYLDFDSVLARADIVTLHAPYTKENHHLINEKSIGVMKKGAYIINTARGELIDTDALVSALQSGHLAGAGLDVMEGEKELKEEIEILSSPSKAERVEDYKTLLEDHVLMDMPNVIVTPHIAFYTKEAVAEILKITRENIQAFLSGEPANLVK